MTNLRWLAMVRKASPRQLEINDIGPHGGRPAHICQDRANRIAKGNPSVVIVRHSYPLRRHSEDDSGALSNGEKAFPRWKF